MKVAEIRFHDTVAGYLVLDEEGYNFYYTNEYKNSHQAKPISLTLPLVPGTFNSNTLFPFFDGLIPEGWLLDIAQRNWKLDIRDRMELLLVCCKDCIGAVSVRKLISLPE